jgi:putative spermidine/putrescine transport system permease protein
MDAQMAGDDGLRKPRMTTSHVRSRNDSAIGLMLVALPAAFLLCFFVAPNAFLLTAGFLKSEAQVLTDEVTLDNYTFLLGRSIYRHAIVRTFGIGICVGLLVVVLAFPLAYFLARTTSRWKGALIALSLSPLLASVIVRTYGWWVIFNNEGALNIILQRMALTSAPISFLPSTGAIIVGLTHSLLPYGVLTILSSLNGLDPNLERAALSLGATRSRTFFEVTLPLSLSGVVGGFLIAFSLSISAYATPAILGGPSNETIATLIYTFMVTILDWSIGSALGTILIVSAILVLAIGSALGSRRFTL